MRLVNLKYTLQTYFPEQPQLIGFNDLYLQRVWSAANTRLFIYLSVYF